MPTAAAVFTPNGFPQYTFVDRTIEPVESALRMALSSDRFVISLSGPSKSGKTVLLQKHVDKDNLIVIYGASIKQAGDLWRIALSWMGSPITRETSSAVTNSGGASVNAEAQAGVILARGSLGGEARFDRAVGETTTITEAHDGLTQVSREIAGSDYVIFVDDFHYIPDSVQRDVAKEIKAGLEAGIKFCVASVPHRSDDVFRSNHELRGRSTSIDLKYWNTSDLETIAKKGFQELNVEIDPAFITKLAQEALGSPQLMQNLCLCLCFTLKITEPRSILERVDVTDEDVILATEICSTTVNYQSLLEALHAGPRQRGRDRNYFTFSDRTTGDVYRAILLAIKADPGQLSFTYDDMVRRVRNVTVGEGPTGGSVSSALEQMDAIAEKYPPKALEWIDDVLEIIDPLFIFYVRSSRRLDELARGRV
jgi:hypothetical protein